MIMRTVIHDTIVIERDYDASLPRVFNAWADPQARLRWGPPAPGTALEFDETDFQVGGRDISRCGGMGKLDYSVEAIYLDIVLDSRIVMVETIMKDGVRLSSSLLTVELQAEGHRTRLIFTDQISAFDGSDMVAGNKAGWTASLNNLATELAQDLTRPRIAAINH